MVISTHAPTQGATNNTVNLLNNIIISTHAPTQGATTTADGAFLAAQISTHAPTQGATLHKNFTSKSCGISTHAPTQGATFKFAFKYRFIIISTHAPTQGATGFHALKRIVVLEFQPTPPHRGRLQNFIKILINLFKFLFKSSKTKDQFLSHVLFLCIILSFFLRESPCLSLCTSHSHIFNKLEFQTYQFHSPYLYAQLYFCTVPLKHNIEYYLFLNQLHPIIVFLS